MLTRVPALGELVSRFRRRVAPDSGSRSRRECHVDRHSLVRRATPQAPIGAGQAAEVFTAAGLKTSTVPMRRRCRRRRIPSAGPLDCRRRPGFCGRPKPNGGARTSCCARRPGPEEKGTGAVRVEAARPSGAGLADVDVAAVLVDRQLPGAPKPLNRGAGVAGRRRLLRRLDGRSRWSPRRRGSAGSPSRGWLRPLLRLGAVEQLRA